MAQTIKDVNLALQGGGEGSNLPHVPYHGYLRRKAEGDAKADKSEVDAAYKINLKVSKLD